MRHDTPKPLPLDSALRQLMAAQAAVLGQRHIPRDDRFAHSASAPDFAVQFARVFGDQSEGA